MARRVCSNMFPGEAVDDRFLRRGDECDRSTINAVLGNLSGGFDEGRSILQNENAWSQFFIGDTRLYHTFYRKNESSPYTYAGLCEYGEHKNMHPEKAQKVYIISQFHSEDDEEWKFNALFAKSLARHCFLETGDIPILPHIYFPTFMHDSGYERDFGIAAGHLFMDMCDSVVLAVIDGHYSEGMIADLDHATVDLGLHPIVRQFTMDEARKFVAETEREVYGDSGSQY